MEFPKLTVSGTPFEMGADIGSRCRERIREALDRFLPADGTERERLLSAAQRYQPMIEQWDESYAQEIMGIRAGADIGEREALFLHTRWELDVAPGAGCTSFAVRVPPRADGGMEVYAGINHDVGVWSRKQATLLHMQPDGGPALLTMAYPGSIVLDGMNGYGLCLCGNSLYGKTALPGIPHGLVKRLLLRQTHAADCVELAVRLARSGKVGFSANFTVCDADGHMACLEFIGGKLDVIRPEPGRHALVHTNHLLSGLPELRDDQGDLRRTSNTHGRLGRFEATLREAEAGAAVDLAMLRSLCMDHDQFPHSICSHVGDDYHTAFSLIMLPRKKELYVAYGHPCEHEYRRHTLGEEEAA